MEHAISATCQRIALLAQSVKQLFIEVTMLQKIYYAWSEYIRQRWVIDILVYSYLPLVLVLTLLIPLSNLFIWFLAFFTNYLLYVAAFIYNDIEDRIEDVASPGKRFRNPFGYQDWTLSFGVGLLATILIVSVLLSLTTGNTTLALISMINFALGIAYSNKWLRLKHWPLIDLLSHGSLLAGIQGLYWVVASGQGFSAVNIMTIFAVVLFSIGGDLENEYRDFDDDRQAGLKNSAYFLGAKLTFYCSRLLWIIATVVIIGLIIDKLV